MQPKIEKVDDGLYKKSKPPAEEEARQERIEEGSYSHQHDNSDPHGPDMSVSNSLRVGSAGTPTHTLDIDGDAEVSGNLYVRGNFEVVESATAYDIDLLILGDEAAINTGAEDVISLFGETHVKGSLLDVEMVDIDIVGTTSIDLTSPLYNLTADNFNISSANEVDVTSPLFDINCVDMTFDGDNVIITTAVETEINSPLIDVNASAQMTVDTPDLDITSADIDIISTNINADVATEIQFDVPLFDLNATSQTTVDTPDLDITVDNINVDAANEYQIDTPLLDLNITDTTLDGTNLTIDESVKIDMHTPAFDIDVDDQFYLDADTILVKGNVASNWQTPLFDIDATDMMVDGDTVEFTESSEFKVTTPDIILTGTAEIAQTAPVVDIDGTTRTEIDTPDLDITAPDFDIVSSSELEINTPLLDLDATDTTLDGVNFVVTESSEIEFNVPLFDVNASVQMDIDTLLLNITAPDTNIVSSTEFEVITPLFTANADVMAVNGDDMIITESNEFEVNVPLVDFNVSGDMTIDLPNSGSDMLVNVNELIYMHASQITLDADGKLLAETPEFDIDFDTLMTIDGPDLNITVPDIDIVSTTETEITTPVFDINATELDIDGTNAVITETAEIELNAPLVDVNASAQVDLDAPILNVTVPDINITSTTEAEITTPLFDVNATDMTIDGSNLIINESTEFELTAALIDINSAGQMTIDLTGSGSDLRANVQDVILLHSYNQILLDAETELQIDTPELDINVNTTMTINSPDLDIVVPDIDILSTTELEIETPLLDLNATATTLDGATLVVTETTEVEINVPLLDLNISSQTNLDAPILNVTVPDINVVSTTEAEIVTPLLDLDATNLTVDGDAAVFTEAVEFEVNAPLVDFNASGPMTVDVTGAGNNLTVNVENVMMLHSSNQIAIDGDSEVIIDTPALDITASTEMTVVTDELDIDVSGPMTVDITGAGNDLTITVDDVATLHSYDQVIIDGENEIEMTTDLLDIDAASQITINSPDLDITVPDIDIVAVTELELTSPTIDFNATAIFTVDTPNFDIGATAMTVDGSTAVFTQATEFEVNAPIIDLNSTNDVNIDASDEINIYAQDDVNITADDTLTLHSGVASSEIIMKGDTEIEFNSPLLDLNGSAQITVDTPDMDLSASVELQMDTALLDINATNTTLDGDGAVFTFTNDFEIDSYNASITAQDRITLTSPNLFLVSPNISHSAQTTYTVEAPFIDMNATTEIEQTAPSIDIDGTVQVTIDTPHLDIGATDTDIDGNTFDINGQTMIVFETVEFEVTAPMIDLNASTEAEISAPLIDIDGANQIDIFTPDLDISTTTTNIGATSEMQIDTSLFDVNATDMTVDGENAVFIQTTEFEVTAPLVDLNASNDVTIDADDDVIIHANGEVNISAGTTTTSLVMNDQDATLTLPSNTSKFLVEIGTSPNYGTMEVLGDLIVRGDLTVVDSATAYNIDQLTLGTLSQYNLPTRDEINIYGELTVKSQTVKIDADAGAGLVDVSATTEIELSAPTIDIDAATAITIDTPSLEFTGNLAISEWLRHIGDADTYLRFQDDRVALVAGGKDVIAMAEGTDPDIVYIGDQSNTMDVNLNGILMVDGSLGSVGVGGYPGSGNKFRVLMNGSQRVKIEHTGASNSPMLELVQTGATGGNPNVDNGLLVDINGNGVNTNSLRLATNAVTHFIVKEDGNTGIGTDSPGTKLNVVNDATGLAAGAVGTALFRETVTGVPSALVMSSVADNGGVGNKGAIIFDAGATGTASDNKLILSAEVQDALRNSDLVITGNGRVGINTTIPGGRFEVVGSTSVHSNATPIVMKTTLAGNTTTPGPDRGYYQELSFNAGNLVGTGLAAIRHYANAHQNSYSDLSFWTTNHGGGGFKEVMRITGEGTVGIGRTSPADRFHVASATGEAFVSIENITTQQDAGIKFINASTEKWKLYKGYNTDHHLYLENDSSDPTMTWLQSGGVGIGTTSPSGKLNIVGDTIITGTNSGAINLYAQYSGTPSNPGMEIISQAGVTTFQHNANGGATRIVGTLGVTGGDNWFTGNLGLGTTSPDGRLDVRGGPIVLSDSDVTHGLTGIVPTNVYGKIGFCSATNGGLIAQGISEVETEPLILRGIFSNTNPTDSNAAVRVQGGKGSGTGWTSLAAAETVFQVLNYTSPLMTILGDGRTGIGTTVIAGTNKLQVQGNMQASAGVIGVTHWVSDPAGGIRKSVASSELHFRNSGGAVEMTLDETGRLGIGSSNPALPLDLYRSDAGTMGARIYNTSTAATSAAQLQMITNGNNFQITSHNSAHAAYPKMTRFYSTAGAASISIDAGTPGEGVFVEDGGQVGIGTIIPLAELHVKESSGANRVALFENTNADAYVAFQASGTTSSTSSRLGFVGDKITLYTNNTLGFAQDSSGNVGIKTLTPRDDFSVFGHMGVGYNTAMDVTSSGYVNLRLGMMNGVPSNATDAFIGVNSTNGPGQLAGDLCFVSRTTTGVNSAIRMFTGPTDPVERLSIIHNGNVGINTYNPGQKLSVEGSATANENIARFNNQGNFASRIWLRNSSRSAYFSVSGGTADTIAAGTLPYGLSMGLSGSVSPLQFWNGTPASVKMTILADGEVGIGVTDPASRLQIGGSTVSTDNAIIFGKYVTASQTNLPTIRHGSVMSPGASNDLYIGTRSGNGGIVFYTGAAGGGAYSSELGSSSNASRMGIDYLGNVSIGTLSAQGAQFLVKPTANKAYTSFTQGAIVITKHDDVATCFGMGIDDNVGTYGTAWLSAAKSGTANINMALQPEGGRVGIGTISPESLVEIESGIASSAQTLLSLTTRVNGANDDSIAIDFRTNVSLDSVERVSSRIESIQTGVASSHYGELAFSTMNATALLERMRIRATGEVGIGKTNPAQKLEVYPDTANSARIGRAHIGYDGTNSDYAIFSHLDRASNSDCALKQSSGGDTWLNAGGGNQIRITSNGPSGVQFLTATQASGVGSVVINETSADIDFRVESNGDPYAIMMDATNGYVGLSTSAPKTIFHIDAISPRVLIQDTTQATNQRLIFGTHVDYWNFGIGIENANRLSIGPTSADGDGSNDTVQTSSLNIHGSGSVGIGTTDPVSKLKVYQTQELQPANIPLVEFHTGGTAEATKGGILHLNTDRGTGTDDVDLFKVAGTGGDYLSVRNTGNVGVGHNNPGSVRLNVLTPNSGHLAAQFKNSHATGSFGVVIEAGDDAGNYSLDARNKSGVSLMRVRGDGNVGIGITNPATHLQIFEDANPVLSLSSNSNTDKTLSFRDVNSEVAYVKYDYESGLGVLRVGTIANRDTALHAGGSEVMRIHRSNLVGIGTNNPGSKLDVAGVIRARGDSASEYLEMSHGGSNAYLNWAGDGQLDFRKGGAGVAQLTATGSFSVEGVYIQGRSDDTTTLGTSSNRFATLYMASTIDHASALNFVSGATTTLSLDTAGNAILEGNLTVNGTITGTLVADEQIEDVIGAMVDAGGTESGINVTYSDNAGAHGALNFTINDSHSQAWSSLTGVPATATTWPTWAQVTGKPTTFNPTSHSHGNAEITDVDWSKISSKPAQATTWPTWAQVTGKPTTFNPTSHSHGNAEITDVDWSKISSKPAQATTWPTWAQVTGKPTTFAPSSHNHAWSNITSGVPDFATRWPAWSEVTSKPSTFAPSSHSHGNADITDVAWTKITGEPAYTTRWPTHAEVTGKPSYATRWPAWSEVTSKPSTFAPSSHDHSSLEASDGSPDPALSASANGFVTAWNGMWIRSATTATDGYLTFGNNGVVSMTGKNNDLLEINSPYVCGNATTHVFGTNNFSAADARLAASRNGVAYTAHPYGFYAGSYYEQGGGQDTYTYGYMGWINDGYNSYIKIATRGRDFNAGTSTTTWDETSSINIQDDRIDVIVGSSGTFYIEHSLDVNGGLDVDGTTYLDTTYINGTLDVDTSNEEICDFRSSDTRGYILLGDNATTTYLVAEDSTLSLGFNASKNNNNLNIDNSGNVGIGTSNPGAQLQVVGSASSYAVNMLINKRIKCTGNDGGVWTGDHGFFGGYNTTNQHVGIYNAGAWKIFCKDDGLIGIGCTTPLAGYQVDIGGNLAVNGGTFIKDQNISKYLIFTSVDSTNNGLYWDDGVKSLSIWTATAQRLTVESGGFVGIGTNNPGDKLELYGVAEDVVFTVHVDSDNVADIPSIRLSKNHNDGSGRVPTIDEERLGNLNFTGVDQYQNEDNAVQLRGYQDGAASDRVPGRLQIHVSDGTANNAVAQFSDLASTNSLLVQNTKTDTLDRAAVRGERYGRAGYGYGGYFRGGFKGVWGYVSGSSNYTHYGVQGQATNGGTGGAHDFYAAGSGTYHSFTGNHETVLESSFGSYEPGMIVSCTGNTNAKGISATFPEIKLSNTSQDSTVFGVITGDYLFTYDSEKQSGKLDEDFDGKNIGAVNAVGEGKIWITNYGGDVSLGDYVTSSPIAGYGQKQSDDLQHSYTVAKITQSIDWNSITETIDHEGTPYKKVLVTCTYHCG